MKDILLRITADAQLEARWLNTVSLLELIGARKIAKTVCRTHPQVEILEHFADESRHALAFKKLALAVDPQVSAYLCRDEAMVYFQSLDHGLKAQIRDLIGIDDEFLNYLLTTTLIERRAMKLYPVYREISRHSVVVAELDRVIAEETSHRAPLETLARERLWDFSEGTWESLQAFEDGLFADFAAAVALAVKPAA